MAKKSLFVKLYREALIDACAEGFRLKEEFDKKFEKAERALEKKLKKKLNEHIRKCKNCRHCKVNKIIKF